ncbi:MAG TPA: hypothetical protein VK005_01540 [Acholeplasma sp.]|nr:hypothetical protein [Acholeplasma sp.]
MRLKLLAFITLLFSLPTMATIARYNYSYYGDVIHSAPGMTFAMYFNGQSLGTNMLQDAEDMIVYNNKIYIISSLNNGLIVVNDRFELEKTYTQFKLSPELKQKYISEGKSTADLTLNKPRGIEVKSHGIYIADSSNFRIIKLNSMFEVVAVFDTVDDVTFENIQFEPIKITTDSTGRMYVVAKNIYEGILELDIDGSFNRYTGVNPLTLTPLEIFQRSFMTEEQIAKLPRFLPTEYTNVAMSDKNFIYATSLPSDNNSDNMIQLINPKGIDVLKRNGYQVPKGDIEFVVGMNNYVIDGPSKLVDIAIYKNGIYTVLDQKRSRLFTYDSEGSLLYINGDIGSQSDRFAEGVAIDYLNDYLLVLDKRQATVVIYEHTEFGKKVNQAIAYHEQGEFELAASVWEEVLTLNTNYEVAYNGIGKFYLRKGDYKTALEYFNVGKDKFYYSKAFKQYRNQILKDNFGYIIGAIVLIPVVIGTVKLVKRGRKGEDFE